MKSRKFVDFYEDPKDQQKRTRRIRRNQQDPTAAFSYSLGCSLVHFAMFVSSMTIKRPDIEKARLLDIEHEERINAESIAAMNPMNFLSSLVVNILNDNLYQDYCANYAQMYTNLITVFALGHAFCAFVTL